MAFTVGVGEILTFVCAISAAGYALIKMALGQFEKRLDEKLKNLDTVLSDVQRLELEIVRTDSRAAQIYVTKAEHDRVLERIFIVLERVESKLDQKLDKDDYRP